MKKVIIEITENGWNTTVQLDEKTFVEKYKSTPRGADWVEGDFEAEDDISDELYNALTGFSQYDIMRALSDDES